MTKKEKAKIIIENIIKDLTNRKGLRDSWYSIDPSIRKEIKEKWTSIIIKTNRQIQI